MSIREKALIVASIEVRQKEEEKRALLELEKQALMEIEARKE